MDLATRIFLSRVWPRGQYVAIYPIHGMRAWELRVETGLDGRCPEETATQWPP